MSFDVIIAFIVIAVISTLVSKVKEQGATRKHSEPEETPTKASKQRPIQKRRNPSNLEDMVRELEEDIKGAFNHYDIREEELVYETKTDTDNVKTDSIEMERSKSKEKANTDMVKKPKKEITTIIEIEGKRHFKSKSGNINLNRQAVLQGIIMSEVLGKPKSLRNKQIR